MTANTHDIDGRRGFPWRLLGWGGAAFALLIPLIAHAPWTLADFFVMGVLIGSAGLVLELAVRASGNIAYRAGAAVAVAGAFLLIWVNLAVGFLGSEDNPANLMFLGVLGTAMVGSLLARFQPAGMARALVATGAAQLLVGTIGLAGGYASPGYEGLYEVAVGTSLFGALWLFSAWLFRRAAGKQAPAVAAR
jgi:hypothetical protein